MQAESKPSPSQPQPSPSQSAQPAAQSAAQPATITVPTPSHPSSSPSDAPTTLPNVRQGCGQWAARLCSGVLCMAPSASRSESDHARISALLQAAKPVATAQPSAAQPLAPACGGAVAASAAQVAVPWGTGATWMWALLKCAADGVVHTCWPARSQHPSQLVCCCPF